MLIIQDKRGFLDDILRKARTTPAPGSYNTLSSFDILDAKKVKDADFLYRLHASRKHHSAAFESKTIRDPLKPRTDLPGPGAYNIPPAIQAPVPPPPEKQFFNTYGPRFKDVSYFQCALKSTVNFTFSISRRRHQDHWS
jgi:hypothetical protein